MELVVQMTLNVMEMLALLVNQGLANVIQFIFGIVHMFWVVDYRMADVKILKHMVCRVRARMKPLLTIIVPADGALKLTGYLLTTEVITFSHLVMAQLLGIWKIVIYHAFIRKNVEMDIRFACLRTMMVTIDVFLFQQNLHGVV
jgi:hypothetical protein